MVAMQNIELHYDAFVHECEALLRQLGSTDAESFRLFVHPLERVRWLALQAETTPHFSNFVQALPVPKDESVAFWVGAADDGGANRAWFLRNVGFYQRCAQGHPPALADIVDRWIHQRWGSRRLYFLEGLRADEGAVTVGSSCVRSLTEEDLRSIFRADTRSAFREPLELSSMVGHYLETPLSTINLEDFYYGPDRSHPWLAYLNLLQTSNVAIRATYEVPYPDAFSLDFLSRRETQPVFGDVSPRCWGMPLSQLQTRVNEFEAGRRLAGHRVETALRCFSRACRELARTECGESPLGGDPVEDGGGLELAAEREALERAILDLATAMEAIFLDAEPRRKTARLVMRAGSLLSGNDEEVAVVQQRIADAYDVRSRIVHADAAPPYRVLHDTAAFLRQSVRRSLVALLRLGGDQSRILTGVADARVREANRTLVDA